MAAPRQIILVAGLLYPEYKYSKRSKNYELAAPSAGSWRSYCLHLAHQRLVLDRTVAVTLFDFFTGTREQLRLGGGGVVSAPRDLGGDGSSWPRPLVWNNYRLYKLGSGADDTKLVSPPPTMSQADYDRLNPSLRYFRGVDRVATSLGRNAKADVTWSEYWRVRPLIEAENSVSVGDVYAFIKALGRGDKTKRTLTELHFFSHSFGGGPILVNTDDYPSADPNARSINDKDPRPKDFLPVNMNYYKLTPSSASDSDGLLDFIAAWAPRRGNEVRAHIWGCSWDRPMYQMLRVTTATMEKAKIIESQYRRPLIALTYSDEDTWGISEAEFHRRYGWAASDARHAGHESATLSVNDVRQKVLAAIAGTYPQTMARTGLGRVAAAFPGTYSNTDDPRTKPQDRELMHVPLRKPADFDGTKRQSFRRILKFYRKVVRCEFEADVSFDPEFGRGYGIHPVNT